MEEQIQERIFKMEKYIQKVTQQEKERPAQVKKQPEEWR